MNSEISYRQVDTLVLNSSNYKQFRRVSRYMFYIQRLGFQQKSAYWHDFEVGDESLQFISRLMVLLVLRM